jgi:hypothetical protein
MRKNGKRRELTASARSHAASRPLRALAVAGIATAFLASGRVSQDAICDSGQYPVKAAGGTTGQACQADGHQPPAGFVRYPAGKVPQHVGDKRDTYWSTVVVTKNGHIVQR